MGEFFVFLGIGLSALLVVYVVCSLLTPVDPEDEEEDDDTDLYTPTASDIAPRPLGTSTDTGVWVRAEGRVLKVEEIKTP